MNLHLLIIALVLAVSAGAPAQEQGSLVPAGELVSADAANELKDRVQQLKWMYVIVSEWRPNPSRKSR